MAIHGDLLLETCMDLALSLSTYAHEFKPYTTQHCMALPNIILEK